MTSKHSGAYPEGGFPILLAYAFRPFFTLLPLYLMVSILLWGLFWGGVLQISFTASPVEWHIYEMLFGLAGAGIAGFLLTALPEFFEGESPVVGRPLLLMVLLWVFGRISFWLLDVWGLYPAAISHLTLMFWLVFVASRPILRDPSQRHVGLLLALTLLTSLQVAFFASRLGWIELQSMAVLKLAVGAFMILILQVFRRVNTGVINDLFEHWQIDDVFLARPPRYNLATFTIVVFSIAEWLIPNNAISGWIGLACAAALLSLLNDFLQTDTPIMLRYPVWMLWCVLLLMAIGYGLMGIDYLYDDVYGINHFRHFLLTGALGVAYMMILSIVTTVHTGRVITYSRWLVLAVLLIIMATLIRTSIPFFVGSASMLYMWSAIFWAGAFGIYFWRFAPLLWKPRVDGQPG